MQPRPATERITDVNGVLRIEGALEQPSLRFLFGVGLLLAGAYFTWESVDLLSQFHELRPRKQFHAIGGVIVGPVLFLIGGFLATAIARHGGLPTLTISPAGLADSWLPQTISWADIARIDTDEEYARITGMASAPLRVRLKRDVSQVFPRKGSKKFPFNPRTIFPSVAKFTHLPSAVFFGLPPAYIAWLIAQHQPHLVSVPADFDPWDIDIRYRTPQQVATSLVNHDPTMANALVRGRLEKAQTDKNEVLIARWQAVAERLSQTMDGSSV